MKRKLALLLSLITVVGCSSACGQNSQPIDRADYNVPTFEETEGIRFTAYSGPTVENWNGFSRNVSTLTDEHFQKFVDAGFNKLIAIHEGSYTGADVSQCKDVFDRIKVYSQYAEKDAVEALALAEKYGVDYYVRDWSFYEMNRYWDEVSTYEEYKQVMENMFYEENPYIHSSAFAGMFGRDEPGADQFERLEWQVKLFNEYMEKNGVEDAEFLLNLLPSYGSTNGYGGERGDPISYQEYIQLYFEKFGDLLGYVSYDFYPFLQDNFQGSLLRSNHLYNLEFLARMCKEYDAELRTFVQTGGDFTGLRDLTSIGDFRLQVYSNLAFGAKEMTYYEYGTFNSQVDGEFGLINLQDGTYNYTYEMAKVVNNEAHAFEDAYLHYDYQGVMCYSALGEGQIHPSFRNVQQKMLRHDRIKSVKHSQDAIISAFADEEGNDAFMLVNYTDPYFDLNNRVTIEFNDADALLMYRLGEEMFVPLKDGKYTFELYPGEGRFIIPVKKK